jgi:hypothetical protein
MDVGGMCLASNTELPAELPRQAIRLVGGCSIPNVAQQAGKFGEWILRARELMGA